MNRIPNTMAGDLTSRGPWNDLDRLKEANKAVKILQPEKIQELESLLTQSTVSKDDLQKAGKILKVARATLDRDGDKIGLHLAEAAGIDWQPGDGWTREVGGVINQFGASTVCLHGGVLNMQSEFPKGLMEMAKDAMLSAGRILSAIPIGIAVGLAVMVSVMKGDNQDFNW